MAVRFTAAGQFYNIGLSPTLTAYSVTGWVKINTNRNTYSTAWDFIDLDEGDYHLTQTSESGTAMSVFSGTSPPTLLANLTVGTWYFVGVSFNGSSTLTGRVRALGAGSFTTISQTMNAPEDPWDEFRIGESHFTGEWLNGALAHVKVWNAALSGAELEAEYQYAYPVRTANLWAHYRFDTASNVDSSGNGRTLSGGSGASSEASPAGLIEPGGSTSVIHGWGMVPVK